MKPRVTPVHHPQVGVCGLSCRLCPRYHTDAKSRCEGCKTQSRMAAGCPFLTCAVKRRGIEFCWQCEDHPSCERWAKHREHGRHHDSFVSYQALEDNLAYIPRHGIARFEQTQQTREGLLTTMLRDFNDGRSRSYYCLAATLLPTADLRLALKTAQTQSASATDPKQRAALLHSLLDHLASRRGVPLKLRASR